MQEKLKNFNPDIFSFFFTTALNVKNRHELLLSTLGYVFPEEEHAYWLVNLLIRVLPLTISIAAVVDMLLAVIYMNFTHPWKKLLAKDEKKEKSDEAEAEVSQSAESQEDPEVANGAQSGEVQEVSESAQCQEDPEVANGAQSGEVQELSESAQDADL